MHLLNPAASNSRPTFDVVLSYGSLALRFAKYTFAFVVSDPSKTQELDEVINPYRQALLNFSHTRGLIV